ncbi:hypothetical protein BC939DRAFT_451171, partial [Gamsiella multidivaricata]|uniref:uncharacterized protein n=1 Tax=Gamsiella multidivaricata TaxID=101098 RepID=UPI00221EA22F
MTPAPSSRNRRSATLGNIPPPSGPPPPPPQLGYSNSANHGYGYGHGQNSPNPSPHSSYSSQSGQLNVNAAGQLVYPGGAIYDPPRASFSSSSRASPVGRSRSGRDREQELWSDGNWRSIFDAALVKAQQAVQLDELQETTLAANLYAQAANDLGRVIPMCSSEKKKQSMLAIQAIYLDRVSQLKESALNRNGGIPPTPSASHSPATSESHDGGYGHHYSVSSNRGAGYGDESQQYPYQPPMYNQPQQQRYQYQPPPPHSQLQQPYQFRQAQQPQIQQPEFQQLEFQQPELQQPEPQSQPEKSFRLFSKKRSKTQPSAPQPPELGQFLHAQDYSGNYNPTDNNGHLPYDGRGVGGNDAYSTSYVDPPRTPSPTPVVSPIFMSHPPVQSQGSGKKQESDSKKNQDVSSKSSKWRPFGKKKSKSFSNNETSTAFNLQQESAQIVPVLPLNTEQEQMQQSMQYLVDSVNHADVYPQRNQADWYVEDGPEDSFDDEDQDQYYDNEDEDIDPFYIADTKGRAQAFEGMDSGKAGPKSAISQEEPQSMSRKPLNHSASSYSQEQSFTPNFNYSQPDPPGLSAQHDSQDQDSSPLANEHAYISNYTDDMEDEDDYHNVPGSSFQQQYQAEDPSSPLEQFVDAEEMFEEEISAKETEEEPKVRPPARTFTSAFIESTHEIGADDKDEPKLEKSKSKRTWFGKKKKDKEKDTDKEMEKEKDSDRLGNVAKLMDEAMFGGGSFHKPSKDKLKDNNNIASLTKVDPQTSEQQHQPPQAQLRPQPPAQAEEDSEMPATSVTPIAPNVQDPSSVQDASAVNTSETTVNEQQQLANDASPQFDTELPDLQTEDVVAEAGASPTSQDAKSIVSDTQKRIKSRHFSIFKSKKNKDSKETEQPEEGSTLIRTVTNDDDKSMHSQQTHQSSQSADRKLADVKAVDPKTVEQKSADRKAAEMAVALAVRPKEKEKKRDSDEYVPYEYQEDVEGPLMERVEVDEDREVIGFVLPVEEIMDYTLEGNEEAALENWDSWVNQLESFEKVLADKGLKKEKVKKAKKVKELKPTQEDNLYPLGSLKANRSSIFGIGRSDNLKSRTSTTLDLNSTLRDSRPLSMSTTLLDDASIAPRPSFQSSRSGESEAPSQLVATPSTRKRWWNPKRKETPSIYRASNAFSFTDLDQDRHLSTLLQSPGQVRSNEDLTLSTQLLSLPITLSEPSTPAPDTIKEASTAMETVSKQIEANKEEPEEELKEKPKEEPKEKTNEKSREEPREEPKEEVDETPVAPMPKVKTKSSKPKLLPISTPLPQLLKMDSAEELWLYVQQAKTYATSRMNKGDKRSAAIALKRAQALETRWQE